MRRAGWHPVGSGINGMWGYGAGQPGRHTDQPGVARAGPTWLLSLCCPACPGWSPMVPGTQGLAWPRGQGTSGQCNTIHSCLSVVPEPGRLGWRKGVLQGRQRDLLPMPPSWPSPSASRELWERRQPVTQGFFPSKGTRAQVTAAWPWGRGDTGPLIHQVAGGHDSAGLCPCRRRGCGGKIQVLSLCCSLPWSRGHQATLRARPRA